MTSWLDRRRYRSGSATVRGFLEQTGDPELDRQVEILDAILFGGKGGGKDSGSWSGKELYRRTARARRHLKKPESPAVLAPDRLNP